MASSHESPVFGKPSAPQQVLSKLHSEEDVLKDDVKLLLQPLKSHVPEVQEQGI